MEWRLLIAASVLIAAAGARGISNHIPGSSRGVSTGDELVAAVVDTCFDGQESTMRCVRKHALSYLDTITEGAGGEEGSTNEEEEEAKEDGEEERSMSGAEDDRLDRMVLERTQRYIHTHQLRVQLPELVFQGASLTVRGDDGTVDLNFPPKREGESRAYAEGRNNTRDMMQNKMLLPILLLLKLKLKALTPILLVLVAKKALKALILSKISILLVLGFLASQLFKKAGMMPMMPAMSVEPAPMTPMTAYGPPMTSYGPPSQPPPPVTQSSYEPSWEPSAAGGPYARWDAHSQAYNAYAPQQHQQPPVQQLPTANH